MRRIVPALAGLTTAALLLGACGSDSSKSSDSTEKSSSSSDKKGATSSGSLKALDACKLATDAEIASVGGSGTGEAFDRPPAPDTQWDSCTWGSLTSGKPVVVVQVQQLGPDAPVNALKILLGGTGNSAKAPATPVSVGTDGKLYNVAILAGGAGGGVGKTIAFKTNDATTVAVSVTGEQVDVPALTALAEKVETNVTNKLG